MRLDKFLQATGLIKRRVLANEACKRGLISINGQPAKPTREIAAGDLVRLDLPRRELEVRILKLLTQPTMPRARRDEFLETVRDIAKTPTDDWWQDDE
ncbi:MAG TPA: S4 domain-containing protein [Candidatus Ozemobacteraceae bacterium]|nr:S4 domain-containing protein [Candidatus Ozemobacteraceae bacterium]